MPPDRLTFDVGLTEWLFTLGLGAGVGLALAGVLGLASHRGSKRAAAAAIVAGLLVMLLLVAAALDRGPATPIDLKLKAYLSTAARTAALTLAAALGLGAGGLVALLALGSLDLRRRRAAVGVLAMLAILVAGIGAVGLLNRAEDSESSIHPAGTEIGAPIPATRIIEGLEIPTGLAAAANGDLVVVELLNPAVKLFRLSAATDAFELAATVDLPLQPGSHTFHVALHPEWPGQPYAYVTAEHLVEDGQTMVVIRVSFAESASPAAATLITGLPLPDGVAGNHYGSAAAFCDGYFYVSTGDSDTVLSGTRPDLAALAQWPTRPEGKILRYQLDGIDLLPAGVIGSDPPVYAMGFRNPFGMACDTATGFPLIGENGPFGHDQVRFAPPGTNHEWPLSVARGYLYPPAYDSGPTSIAPTGVAIDHSVSPPVVYLAAFFSQSIYSFTVGAEGRAASPLRLLAFVRGGAYGLTMAPDGCVYFSDIESIWRLENGACAP
ncbi:MAG: PQQ-dependent sugar dehydrogenase [Dehalococcoidia bacterium]